MRETITIDLVTQDDANEEFVLYLVEDGPWPTNDGAWAARLRRIQERVLGVADIAIDGLLAQKYPDSLGKKVRIEIDSPSGTPAQLQECVALVRNFLADSESYAEAIRTSKSIGGMRVVTGAEMGRFRRLMQ